MVCTETSSNGPMILQDCLKIGRFPASVFNSKKSNMFCIKFCRWLDSNCGPLPTEPQPLPIFVKTLECLFISVDIFGPPTLPCHRNQPKVERFCSTQKLLPKIVKMLMAINSVTRKKWPNVYKSFPKMISIEK